MFLILEAPGALALGLEGRNGVAVYASFEARCAGRIGAVGFGALRSSPSYPPPSGHNPSTPASLAAHSPRSVIRPVTSRAGVTSKA